MSWTDLFIKRPVVSTAIVLMIFIAGVWSAANLPLNLYPQVNLPIVTVTTSYPGASPEIIESYVTSPLQASLSALEGLDYITASSVQNTSTIVLHFHLSQNIDKAVSAVTRQIQAGIAELPAGTLTPTITAGVDSTFYFFLQATSPPDKLAATTDYLQNTVVPQLELLQGVSKAAIWGPKYKMDIILDPEQLVAYNLSAADIVTAIRNYNIPAAPGKTVGPSVTYLLNPNTTLTTENDFNSMIVKNAGAESIYLSDVGRAVFHGPNSNNDMRTYFRGTQGVIIAISAALISNPLLIASQLYQLLPSIQQHLPPDMQVKMVVDFTKYISASLHEVVKAIIESLVAVVLVMLLILGSPRTVFIPLIAIPLSLIGVCFVMSLCHYSFNTLTLLAMVLAIGLVVDDAIVVVENVMRHIESGKSALEAALIGTREIANPVIAMTLTLAAVYTPMLLSAGVTGYLFAEFAMTLAGSVIISGVIALILSPLLCSSILNQKILHQPMVVRAEKNANRIRSYYLSLLPFFLNHQKKVLLVWLMILMSCVALYGNTAKELAPEEDTGILILGAAAPSNVSLNYLERYRSSYELGLNKQKDISTYFILVNNNTIRAYITLKDWDERNTSINALKASMQAEFDNIIGMDTYIYNLSLVPNADMSSNNNIAFVLLGNVDYTVLYQAAKSLEKAAKDTGEFLYLSDDLSFNQPQINLTIDPAAAVSMNITPNSVAMQLTNLLSEGRIQTLSLNGHSYDVQISIAEKFRTNPEDINDIQVPNQNGKLIPLKNVLTMTTSVVPQELNQFQKMHSVTITAARSPDVSFSKALKTLQDLASASLNKNILYDYTGVTREYVQVGERTLLVFAMAFLAIFLVLSVQFNRYRDALIILLGSVPLAIFGGLLPLWLGFSTINIFSQLGLLTLIGLVSKHGILLTEFANHAQIEERLTPLQAIIQAAKLRFRPILMTTLAMMMGAAPLVFASGAGAESRHAIGVVILFGLGIGTLCTLFVVPVLYLWLGRR